ncbi:MAG: hypothetical protein ACM3O5_06035, partial [Betaproteobacteria bacterium]
MATPTSEDTYWAKFTKRNCQANDARSNFADGPVVEKGAQGYMTRKDSEDGRNLKTCDAACGPVPAAFDVGNAAISKARLGDAAMSDAERSLLIEW